MSVLGAGRKGERERGIAAPLARVTGHERPFDRTQGGSAPVPGCQLRMEETLRLVGLPQGDASRRLRNLWMASSGWSWRSWRAWRLSGFRLTIEGETPPSASGRQEGQGSGVLGLASAPLSDSARVLALRDPSTPFGRSGRHRVSSALIRVNPWSITSLFGLLRVFVVRPGKSRAADEPRPLW